MGGRGGYSGKYKGVPKSSLERMLSRQLEVIRSKQILASISTENKFPAVKRKINNARRAIEKANAEIDEIQKALKSKRNKNEPLF